LQLICACNVHNIKYGDDCYCKANNDAFFVHEVPFRSVQLIKRALKNEKISRFLLVDIADDVCSMLREGMIEYGWEDFKVIRFLNGHYYN
jgi:hypothetical protein